MIDVEILNVEEAVQKIRRWVRAKNIQILNVAGPRASKDPEIYGAVRSILKRVLNASFTKDPKA